MKIRLTIEVKLDPCMELEDDEERMWGENEIFIGDGNLILYSNEIGESVGTVKKVTNLVWIDED